MAPLFSKSWTQRTQSSDPRAATSPAQVSTTVRISGRLMRASVRSWRGEKHITLHSPRWRSRRKSSSPGATASSSGSSAAKSFSKTNVDA
jgi:hypothetical protein